MNDLRNRVNSINQTVKTLAGSSFRYVRSRSFIAICCQKAFGSLMQLAHTIDSFNDTTRFA